MIDPEDTGVSSESTSFSTLRRLRRLPAVRHVLLLRHRIDPSISDRPLNLVCITSGITEDGDDSPAAIEHAYKWILVRGSILSVILFILWPLLALPARVFSKGYFTFWVAISMAWGARRDPCDPFTTEPGPPWRYPSHAFVFDTWQLTYRYTAASAQEHTRVDPASFAQHHAAWNSLRPQTEYP